MRGRGGPIAAAVDGPGGPILAGDHRRRDRPFSCGKRDIIKARGFAHVWRL